MLLLRHLKLQNLTGHMLRSVVCTENVQFDCRLYSPNSVPLPRPTTTSDPLRYVPRTLYNTRDKDS